MGANLKVVLLSVLAATTFWFFNALNKSYNARISYPIDFVFEADSLVVIRHLPDHVVIDVSSGGWNLLRKTFWFNIDPIPIALDNPTEVKFMTRSSILPLVTEHLADLNINFLVTDTLHIQIEPKVSKRVVLKVDSANLSLANNYRVVSNIKVSPDTVEIVGPLSIIKELGDVYILSVPRQKINQNFDRKVSVNLIDQKLMSASPDEVNVTFDVQEFVNVTLPVKVSKANFPRDSSIILRDSIVYANYWIRASELKSVSQKDFIVMADLTMLKKKDSTVMPILIASPDNAYDLDYQPDTLKVIIKGRKRQ